MKLESFIGMILVAETLLARGDAPLVLTVGEGFVNPLGFYDATPTFSWKLPVGVEYQIAYRIEVQGDVSWDSGWVKSDQSTWVPYGGKALASRQQLQWRVMFRDQDGKESEWSELASFELGLLSSKDWKAQWIRPQAAGSVASAPKGDYKLIGAVYRSKANPNRSKDVASFVKKGSFVVSNESFGGDPAPGELKELVITYALNRKEKTAVCAENTRGSFPPDPTGPPADEAAVAVLRGEFPVSGEISKARLYVTARGIFELKLNGQKVGNDYFANGWTSYKKRLDTLTYDVSGLVKSGDNKLSAMLGAGWYAGRITWQHDKKLRGLKPELLLQLEITHSDGSVQTVVSDGSWQGTFDGPVVSSTLYDGENYDARKADLRDVQWSPVLADSNLGSARLAPKSFAPVRATERLSVKKITEPEEGRFVFDLGQNMVGWAKLNIPVQKDQTVTIRFAEMLNKDGTLYTANYRSAKSTDYYTSAKTGNIEWEPIFTFHGFRYVELSGLPKGAKPETDWVTGVVLHSDLPRIGTFESSHEKLNQLYRNIIWGQRGNFLDIPTDCPQRDERLGWTGDAQAFCATALLNYDCHAFFKSWLGSMRDDQKSDGRIPHIIPDVLGGSGSPGWQDAGTIIPWAAYVRTGDLELLSENYSMMECLVGWYRTQSKNNLIPKIGGFGDWLQPYAKKGNKGETPTALLGSAFYANSAQILADSAKGLGKTSDARKYADEADAIKKAFGEHYFDSDGKLQNAIETQTGYIVAFEFDLVPSTLKKKAAKNLVRLIDEADDHLRTGFLGTPYIANVLDQTGNTDIAFSLLFKETYPSWFYSINQGATTLWERWNSYSHKDGFGNVAMNSFNHYAYGAIGQWMFERVAGLAPDSAHPGYKHFFVRPLVGGPLTWARAELATPYGKASSGWKKVDDKVVLEVVVPPNTTATIEFPNDRIAETVVAGAYQFELEM